jgi:hypothetical protein
MHGEQDHALLLYVIEPGGIQIQVKAHRLVNSLCITKVMLRTSQFHIFSHAPSPHSFKLVN